MYARETYVPRRFGGGGGLGGARSPGSAQCILASHVLHYGFHDTVYPVEWTLSGHSSRVAASSTLGTTARGALDYRGGRGYVARRISTALAGFARCAGYCGSGDLAHFLVCIAKHGG